MFSGSIKTNYIQPSKHLRDNQIEFKIPEGMVLTSPPRLLDFGSTSTNAADKYNKLAGILANINRVVLYDGANELQDIGLFPPLMAFKNRNHSNDKIKSEVAPKTGCRVALSVNVQEGKVEDVDDLHGDENDSIENGRLYFDMGQVLTFFDSGMVDTDRHNKLRIVIYLNKGTYNDFTGAHTTSLKPVLACDMSENAELMAQLKKVQTRTFKTMEYDRHYMPAITAASTLRKRLNNFGGKTIDRFFIQLEPTEGAANTHLGSVKLPGARVQVYVNNDNLFPDNGVSDALKMGILADAWGDITHCQELNRPLSTAASRKPAGLHNFGQVDYCGGEVLEKVKSLEVELYREHSTVAADDQAIYLNFFAEVPKTLVYSDRGYSIVYN